MSNKNEFKDWSEYKEAVLEGLNEKDTRTMSLLLENMHAENIKALGASNEENKIVLESTSPGSTVTSNISRYDMLFAPLARRVVPALLAMDLVGVQPMPGPQGIVRAIRHRYSETTDNGGPVAGTEASGMNVYDKYSMLALGDDYDAVDALDPFEQTVHLEGNRGKPMDLEVVTDRVETSSRKLSAAWSLEADDDLRALDGLDIESELTASVSDEIMREMDRELIGDLTALAGIVEAFDFVNVDGRYAGEKLAALAIQIDNLSAQIAMKSKRTGASWMVVSQRVFTALKHAQNSPFIPANNGELSISTSLFVGTLGGSIRVYVDPYQETDTVLMGRKGSEMDAGYFYLPYVPMQSSGALRNPETGDFRVLLRTRYGKYAATDPEKSIGDGPDQYARMSIANLTLGFTN